MSEPVSSVIRYLRRLSGTTSHVAERSSTRRCLPRILTPKLGLQMRTSRPSITAVTPIRMPAMLISAGSKKARLPLPPTKAIGPSLRPAQPMCAVRQRLPTVRTFWRRVRLRSDVKRSPYSETSSGEDVQCVHFPISIEMSANASAFPDDRRQACHLPRIGASHRSPASPGLAIRSRVRPISGSLMPHPRTPPPCN